MVQLYTMRLLVILGLWMIIGVYVSGSEEVGEMNGVMGDEEEFLTDESRMPIAGAASRGGWGRRPRPQPIRIPRPRPRPHPRL